MDWVYLAFAVDELPAFVRRLVHPRTRELNWNLRGLSVTIPHKVSALGLVDELDELARRTGAVNTIQCLGDRLKGYNTDVPGIIEPVRRRMDPRAKAAIVLGAGGAAAAACVALQTAGAHVRVLARNLEQAGRLGRRLGISSGGLEEISAEPYDILINATPLGMAGHSDVGFPVEFSPSPCSLVFDLVYNPMETPLIRKAHAIGCPTISGIEMLVEQAALQHEIWSGEPADRPLMMSAALRRLAPGR
jgi:3-dehydroquinate dehydratase/shikimate dehydrogenase